MSAVIGDEIRNPLAALKGHGSCWRAGRSEPAVGAASTAWQEAVRLEQSPTTCSSSCAPG